MTSWEARDGVICRVYVDHGWKSLTALDPVEKASTLRSCLQQLQSHSEVGAT
jgi:hypothetical protein